MILIGIDPGVVTGQVETWRPIAGFDGRYEVSDLGNIRSMPLIIQSRGPAKLKRLKGRLLRQRLDGDGKYMLCDLGSQADGSRCRRTYLVHRLVAEAFCKPSNGALFVNHKDGNKRHNAATNLEWVSRSENMKHAYRVLKIRPSCAGLSGADHPRSRKIIETLRNGLSREWANARAAAAALSVDQSGVHKACKSGALYNGSRWRYAI